MARHLRRLEKAAQNAALRIAQQIAHVPQLTKVPPADLSLSHLPRFHLYYQSLHKAWIAASLPGELWDERKILQAQLWQLSGKISTSYVVWAGRPP